MRRYMSMRRYMGTWPCTCAMCCQQPQAHHLGDGGVMWKASDCTARRDVLWHVIRWSESAQRERSGAPDEAEDSVTVADPHTHVAVYSDPVGMHLRTCVVLRSCLERPLCLHSECLGSSRDVTATPSGFVTLRLLLTFRNG